MRSEVEAIVERLRGGRSTTWLKVIDSAELDQLAVPEARPDAVVEPCRWLLDRVGDGIPGNGERDPSDGDAQCVAWC